ncbi:hypothetical protein NPIL_381771 [Nephila pilipes]|uniref:Uncharacterized protein n=1 Tax=Nephila pilipes TaxID=299642 RepID=A0A8X6MYS9_NEPPI|nr:hypothetical protein NPIL_381771 [Nephila pilipes]
MQCIGKWDRRLQRPPRRWKVIVRVGSKIKTIVSMCSAYTVVRMDEMVKLLGRRAVMNVRQLVVTVTVVTTLVKTEYDRWLSAASCINEVISIGKHGVVNVTVYGNIAM